MNRSETTQMAELVTRRRNLMAEILKSSLEQERAITGGLVEQLVLRLTDKQKLINDLLRIQQQLKPYSQVDPSTRDWVDAHQRERCRREIEETERLQKAILEIDSRCERSMLERKTELFETLNKTTDSASAARAYARSSNIAHLSRIPGGAGVGFDLCSG